MTSQNPPSKAATPLDALIQRSSTTGYEPWLFHRDGWDWEWRSWSRVADHVARSLESLRGRMKEGTRAACDGRQHPDAITAGLAIQAAGGIAVPVPGAARTAPDCDLWVRVGATPAPPVKIESIALPPVLPALSRDEPQPLTLDEDAPSGAIACTDGEPLTPEALAQGARRLDARLPKTGRQPIACVDPGLDPTAMQLLQAWTLIRGAAWVLEPDADAFVETVLWARPTMVWGHSTALNRLGRRLKVRKHRRRSRLECAVVAGNDELDRDPWDDLGIDVIDLGADALDALRQNP